MVYAKICYASCADVRHCRSLVRAEFSSLVTAKHMPPEMEKEFEIWFKQKAIESAKVKPRTEDEKSLIIDSVKQSMVQDSGMLQNMWALFEEDMATAK